MKRSKARTQDPAQREARELVSARDRGRCARCGGPGADYSHRVTRSVGEHRWNPANANLACRTCHQWMHAHPEQARSDGWHVSRYTDPASVPQRRPDGWWLLSPAGGGMRHLYRSDVEVVDGAPQLTAQALTRLRIPVQAL